MEYFKINTSLNTKIMGKIPQSKEVVHHCNIWSEPKFIDKIWFEKVDFIPIVSNPILYPKAKLTDIIYPFGMGSSLKILISGKLKTIIEKNRNHGLQFFQCSIFQNGIEYSDYWLLSVYEVDNHFIDFEKSIIFYRKMNLEKIHEPIIFSGSEEKFNSKIHEKEIHDELFIKNIFIKDTVCENFFLLRYVYGGVGYFVNEKLKKEIEDAGCTGIEFQPSELSYHEWVVSGGEREKIYGKS